VAQGEPVLVKHPAPTGDAATLGLMGWWGYVAGVNGAAAPFLAASFDVSESALAASLGWIGLASLGALGCGRLADRIGRRRVALAAAALLPIGAGATAVAGSLGAYVAAQMLVYACGTTLLAALIVLRSECSAPGERAQAQASGGLAFVVGTALPLAACAWIAPDAVRDTERWRWLWWAAATPALFWPWALASLRDGPAWRAERGIRSIARTSVASAPRARTPLVILAAALIAVAEVASRSWLFFHAVSSLGLAPRRALVVIAAGGVVSLAGFGAGARLANHAGRRKAFVVSAAVFAIGATGYFGASLGATGDPAVLLFVSFAAMGLGGNAATAVFRAHATELALPHRRGSLAGGLAVANAAGWVVAMFATSALASWLGSLGFAVAALVGIAVPAAIALVLCLPETAAIPREVAAPPLSELDVAA
jgi:MFS family permease